MTDNTIENRLYLVEQTINELNGYLKGIVESNQKLIKILKVCIFILSGLAFFGIGTLAYGAIGERGMYTMRSTMR